MTTILRITRHPAEPEQIAALRAIYGPEIEIVERSTTIASADEIRALADEVGAGVVEAVLPPHLLGEAVRVISPRPLIRAVMARTVHEDGSVTFAFTRYERVVRVEIVTEPLG